MHHFKNAQTGESARPLYMKGTSAESSATYILMASPWVYQGKRTVVFCDSHAEVISEVLFQEKVAKALENPGWELLE